MATAWKIRDKGVTGDSLGPRWNELTTAETHDWENVDDIWNWYGTAESWTIIEKIGTATET